MYSRFNFEKSYLHQEGIFLNILYIKIQFQEVKNLEKMFIEIKKIKKIIQFCRVFSSVQK